MEFIKQAAHKQTQMYSGGGPAAGAGKAAKPAQNALPRRFFLPRPRVPEIE